MWYDSGSVAVTNGSTTVTGTGTNFISGAQVGEAFLAPDDKLYEIASITSATTLVLADSYLGSTQSGQDYKIIPTQSLVADLASQVTDLITDYSNVKDTAGAGKFNDGTVTAPAITFEQDQNNGLYRIGSDNYGLSAGGQLVADVSTSGVDVTGTVTADGLTVDGTSNFNGTINAKNVVYLKEPTSGAANGALFIADTQKVGIQAFGASGHITFDTGSGVTQRMQIGSNGDVSFYEDTGTTAKFVWDASAESLGITSSGTALSLTNTNTNMHYGDPVLSIRNNADGDVGTLAHRLVNLDYSADVNGVVTGTYLRMLSDGVAKGGIGLVDNEFVITDGELTERLRIDSAGNVGIGTASPSAKLDVNGGTVYPKVKIHASSNTSRFMRLGMDSATDMSVEANGVGTNLLFKTVGTERARIDSSGNLLVGTTSSSVGYDSADAGIALRGKSGSLFSRDNSFAISANRNGTDGNIVELHKDGSTVGSIGVDYGDIYIGNGHTGLHFNDSGSEILPYSVTDGAWKDAYSDLGYSTVRYKDLYLSGFIYAGETDNSSLPPRMTMERHGDGGGGNIFNTAVAGKAQQGMLYAFDESNGNRLICALSKEDTGNSVITETIMSNGLTVAATNAGGTIQLSSTATTVKMFVTKHILD